MTTCCLPEIPSEHALRLFRPAHVEMCHRNDGYGGELLRYPLRLRQRPDYPISDYNTNLTSVRGVARSEAGHATWTSVDRRPAANALTTVFDRLTWVATGTSCGT